MGAASWRARLQVWGGIGLGLVLLGWFLWSIDLRELAAVMARVHWRWIAAAVAMILVHYAMHGWRWRVLLHHVDPGLDWRTVWRATTILWAFNTLLPLRAGALLRPAVVALERDLPYTTLLFTIVAETVCDVFGTVILLFVVFMTLPPSVAGQIGDIEAWGAGFTLVALFGLAGIVLLSTRRARALMERALAPVPSERARERLLRMFDQLVEGMAAIGAPLQLLEAMAITSLVWVTWLIAIAATLRAFDLDVPLAGALFIEGALTLAMMVPQAPGFLGLFQVVTEQALDLFGAPSTEAKAVALVFWTVCFVPITLLGAWDAYRLGIGLGPGARREAFDKLGRQ